MTTDRFRLLMNEQDELTREESSEGWHFCQDMDGLLANCNDPDGDCFCEMNKHRNCES